MANTGNGILTDMANPIVHLFFKPNIIVAMQSILTKWNSLLAILSGVLIVLICTSGCAYRRPITKPPGSTFAFDIPSLVGLNPSELKTKLGTPDNDTEPTPEERQRKATWSKFWTRKDGITLLVTYRIVDKKTVDEKPCGVTPQALDSRL